MSDLPPSSMPEWLKSIGLPALGAVGGVLSRVLRAMDAKQPVSVWATFVQGIASGYVGLLIMWLCDAAHLQFEFTAVSVGIGGWLGAEASIQLIQRYLGAKVGILKRSPEDGKPAE